MPSGYTSRLYDGEQTFTEFVMGCAPAFGVYSLDVEAETAGARESLARALQRLADAQQELATVLAWTDDEADTAAGNDYDERLCEWGMQDQHRREVLARYDAMLDQVSGWSIPHSHIEFHQFICDQLRGSIRNDCTPLDEPRRLTGVDYRESEADRCERTIGFAVQDVQRYRQAERACAEWVRGLAESLASVQLPGGETNG